MLALTQRYPTQLIDRWTLADGRRVTLRPVLPQDAELEQAMVRGLSREGRYHRYFAPIRELSPQALAALAQVDYRRHLALVVETFVDGEPLVVAEAQSVVADDGLRCEFAVVVADDWRRLGLATRLVEAPRAHRGRRDRHQRRDDRAAAPPRLRPAPPSRRRAPDAGGPRAAAGCGGTAGAARRRYCSGSFRSAGSGMTSMPSSRSAAVSSRDARPRIARSGTSP